jgi:hypothetical protein
VCQACRDDSDMRRQVVSLLANHEESARSERWAAQADAPVNQIGPISGLRQPNFRPGNSLPFKVPAPTFERIVGKQEPGPDQ